MTEMMKQLQKTGIVPVVVLDREEDALPLAECLMEGGLPCAEVTFRTAAAIFGEQKTTAKRTMLPILIQVSSVTHPVSKSRKTW